MNFEVYPTPNFEKAFKILAKRYRSLKSDFLEFSSSLEKNPFQGDELSPGIRKIRLAIKSKGRGKSGGARVITFTIVTAENEGTVYLLEIYDKSDYSTIDVAILQSIISDLGLNAKE